MTDFSFIWLKSHPSGTLGRRTFQAPTLRNLPVSCMGLLRFSIEEAVEKSVRYSIRAKMICHRYLQIESASLRGAVSGLILSLRVVKYASGIIES